MGDVLTYTGTGGETNEAGTHGTSDAWASGGLLASNNFNSSEAIKADKRTFQMQQQAQAFNSAEAQKNRDWEERLSNTSIQRAAADYKAAGYSPLALLGGGGASAPSGSAAHSSGSSGRAASDSGASSAILRGVISLVSRVITSGMSSAAKAAAQGATSGLASAISSSSSSSAVFKAKGSSYVDKPISEREFQDLMSQLGGSK